MRSRIASRSTLTLSLVLVLAAGCTPSGGGGGGGGNVKAEDACGNKTSGPTTVTGTLSADTTWDAAHSPYVIADGDTVKVGSGATLTLGKCTAVVLGSGAGIKVAGHLVTEGTADGKVTFGPSGTDYWQGLTATSPTATLELAYTTLTHGGQATSADAAVVTVTGDRSAAPKATLKVDHVTLSDAAASGVNLADGAAFMSGSTALTVTGTGQQPMTDGGSPIPAYPVRLSTESAGSLPSGTYTGNGLDGILLKGRDSIAQSETLSDPGVPWILGDNYDGGDFAVLPSDSATSDVTVTIAAGATLKLSAGADMTVAAGAGGALGHLVFAGTAAKHVTVTGAGGGRWNDLKVTAPATMSLSYTDVDGGGATGSEGGDGTSLLADGGAAASPTAECLAVDHLSITDSGTVGLLLQGGAAFMPGASDLHITGSGADVSPDIGTPVAVPLVLSGEALYSLPSASTVDGAQPGIWVTGGDITRDTTLADLGAPYLLYGSLTVGSTSGAPATLTLDPGVSLLFSAGERLTINVHGLGQGALQAVGTATQPITMGSWTDTTGAAGDWVGVIFNGDNTSPLAPSRMENVGISFAGGDGGFSGYACEPTSGDENGGLSFFDAMPAAGSITSVSITDSAGNGIVEGWTGLPMDLTSMNVFHNVAECDAVAPMSASGCGANPSCL